MFRIKNKNLIFIAYMYMIVPIIIFFMTWLKWYIGFSFSIILLFGFYVLMKSEYSKSNKILELPVKKFLLISLMLFIFVVLTGQGGFFFQYIDNHWRNAVFRDLVIYKWPVIYKTGNGLVYYLMHWIVPAFLSKLFGVPGTGKSFIVSRLFLLLWSYLGIMIGILLIYNLITDKKKSIKSFFIISLIFMGWSGLDIIGGIISNVFGLTNFALNTYGWWTNFVIDGQPYSYMYRSIIDNIGSVYNQSIVTWIGVPLLLYKPKISIFAFLGLCILPFAPLPFLGLCIIFITLGIIYFINNFKKKSLILIMKKVISIPNLAASFTIFPCFLFYFKCNTMSQSMNGLYVPLREYGLIRIAILSLFYILQFGIYWYLIRKENRKNIFYWIVGISLVIIPFFRIGKMADFCWNVSTPFYFILMIFVIKYVINIIHDKPTINSNILTLFICLGLSFLNPISYIAFGFKIAFIEKTFNLMADGVKTFEGRELGDPVGYTENFLTPNPEKKFFYKYMAKENKNIKYKEEM